ncbi:MAG: DUF4382 domain-containing protein [Candidatus Acidiferrales bacterium]
MRIPKSTGVFAALFAILALSSCGGGASTTAPPPQQQMGSMFTIGTDSPTLPSVVSVQVQITSVQLSDGTTTVNLLNGPQTVDFAKLNGLRSLLDLEDVPTGTYTSAIISVGSVTIQYLDTTQSPPALNTISANVSPMTVTQSLKNPLVLANDDLVGFFMELDLRQSIQTDANGNVNGNFIPTFDVKGLSVEDADAQIDCFYAGVVSVNPAGNQFVIQGPRGRQYTVDTTASTNFDSDEMPSSYDTNTIVEVSGTPNRVTRDITASEVEVVSKDHFFLEGLDTFVQSSNGQASGLNIYARAELPALDGYPLGQLDTIPLVGTEKYMIADLHIPLTSLLFGPGSQLAGQRVLFGGKLDKTTSPPSVVVHRVVLERQGQRGQWVVGSTNIQNGNSGTFSLNDNYLAGVLLPQPLTVLSTSFTNYINLSGLSALSGGQPIHLRVVGFILINPAANNSPVMVARSVEQLNN